MAEFSGFRQGRHLHSNLVLLTVKHTKGPSRNAVAHHTHVISHKQMGPECSDYSPEEDVMNFRSSWQKEVKVRCTGRAAR